MSVKTDQADTVISQVNAFMEASIKDDKSFMQANLRPEFLFSTPRGTIFTRESFLGDFVENPDFKLEIFETIEQNVVLVAGISVLIGIFSVKFAGKDVQYERMTFVLIPGADNWDILNIHATLTNKPETAHKLLDR